MWQGQNTYFDSDIRSRHKTNQGCKEENMKWYVYNGRCHIYKCVRQSWSYPQKEHVIQNFFSALCNLLKWTTNFELDEEPINEIHSIVKLPNVELM